MPLFKKLSSKDNASENSPAPDVTANDEKDDFPQTVAITVEGPVPEHAPQITGTVREGVNTSFMETGPVLVKAPDEVAKVRPFTCVAGLAFRVVRTLETKHHENDKRVIALYLEMKDMLAVLIQLDGVSDPEKIGPDGRAIGGRMQKLCVAIAGDIKKCAIVCYAYVKNDDLAKVFLRSIWKGKFVEFFDIFTKRREELMFALMIHNTISADAANLKLDTVNQRAAELTRRVETTLKPFEEFVAPEQRKAVAIMEEKSDGIAILEDKQAMREFVDVNLPFTSPSGSNSRRDEACRFDVVEPRREIKDDPDDAEKNAESSDHGFSVFSITLVPP